MMTTRPSRRAATAAIALLTAAAGCAAPAPALALPPTRDIALVRANDTDTIAAVLRVQLAVSLEEHIEAMSEPHLNMGTGSVRVASRDSRGTADRVVPLVRGQLLVHPAQGEPPEAFRKRMAPGQTHEEILDGAPEFSGMDLEEARETPDGIDDVIEHEIPFDSTHWTTGGALVRLDEIHEGDTSRLLPDYGEYQGFIIQLPRGALARALVGEEAEERREEEEAFVGSGNEDDAEDAATSKEYPEFADDLPEDEYLPPDRARDVKDVTGERKISGAQYRARKRKREAWKAQQRKREEKARLHKELKDLQIQMVLKSEKLPYLHNLNDARFNDHVIGEPVGLHQAMRERIKEMGLAPAPFRSLEL